MAIPPFLRQIYRRLGPEGRKVATIGSGALTGVAVLHYKYGESITLSGNHAGVTDVSKSFFLRGLFGRVRSRLFGILMDQPVYPSLRPYIYRFAGTLWGINFEECRYPLESYKSLSHLFTRTLKSGLRTIADVSPCSLVSPVDAKVLSLGIVENSRIPRVKGATYNVNGFLGSDVTSNNNKKLRYIVFYLAPHDYHHFHSPCAFAIKYRKHFSGELFPVAPALVAWLNDLYSMNERVIYTGQWEGGVLHYAAVGACNVGNIRLAHDPVLRTNEHRTQLYYLGGDLDVNWMEQSGQDVKASKGERLGEFRFGSTVVLLFEAPEDFVFRVKEGDTVRVGVPVGGVQPVEAPDPPLPITYDQTPVKSIDG